MLSMSATTAAVFEPLYAFTRIGWGPFQVMLSTSIGFAALQSKGGGGGGVTFTVAIDEARHWAVPSCPRTSTVLVVVALSCVVLNSVTVCPAVSDRPPAGKSSPSLLSRMLWMVTVEVFGLVSLY